MRKLISLLLASLIFVLAGCTSVPVPSNVIPPMKTSDDCLVLIRTVIVNKDNVPIAREFHLKLSEGNAPLNVPHDKEGFMFVKIREPGIRIVGLASEVNSFLVFTGNFTGKSIDEPLDIELPYKHGEVVVADITFIQTLEKEGTVSLFNSTRSFISKYDFQKTSDESKAAVLEQFRKRAGSQSWL